VKAEVVIGTPYQRILAVAHEEHADIIVMNIHGKGMLERALMGTTAERVLRAAECPVLAIPPVKA
jgi:nucleotide-binding universal stress UspA family protein